MDPISKAYMSIINESVPSSEVKTDLKVGAAFGDKDNEKNVTSFIKGSGPDKVDGVEKAEEAPDELTSDVDSSLKKLSGVKEAKNPFDVLFNKIVSEETFNFSTAKDNEIDTTDAFDDSSLGDDSEYDSEDESDVDEFLDNEDDDNSENEVTLTIDKDMAEKLIEILQTAIGEEEGEDGEEEEAGDEYEDEGEEETGDEDEDEDEDGAFKESFALDDAEKINVNKAVNELTNPKNHTVNSTLKAKSKKAETPAVGKKSDGKLTPHSTKKGVSKLQNKKSEVPENSAKKGKMLFDLK
jgi:hypothetical protein